jgi:hypothetical protein
MHTLSSWVLKRIHARLCERFFVVVEHRNHRVFNPTATMPLAVKNSLFSDIRIKLVLPGYADMCAANADGPNPNGPEGPGVFCDPAINLVQSPSLESHNPPNLPMTCWNTVADCTVYWDCPKCFFDGNSANIQFQLRQQGSFSNKAVWSIRSTTGYKPEQHSITTGSLVPPLNTVLRGSTSSVVNLKLTMSYFNSDNETSIGTGYMSTFSSSLLFYHLFFSFFLQFFASSYKLVVWCSDDGK